MIEKHSISEEIVSFRGIFQRRLTLLQGTALIVSGTIGAGILSVPYAISRSGALIGFMYIAILGFLMIVLNLMLGQVVSVQPTTVQLPGLARRYLGVWGGYAMNIILYVMLTGVLVVYLIGEGETLSALFGGEPFYWTLGFFFIGAVLIASGMKSIKRVESVLVVGMLAIICMIILAGAPHANITNLLDTNLANLLFPYGVILFAFHGSSSIPEVYSIMKHRNGTFKRAILNAGTIAIIVYAGFALMTVAVMGDNTPQIATAGLERYVGHTAFVFGNIFAFLAMGMSFLITSLSLRDSLVWDHKIKESVATILILIIPFLLFYLGLRNFAAVIDIIGGVLVSLELFFIILIYWRAYRKGDLIGHTYHLHRVIIFIIPLILALGVGAVYSVGKLF